jgi:dCTP deaminase
MSFLNDLQIRQLCLVPTHTQGKSDLLSDLLSEYDGYYFSVKSGRRLFPVSVAEESGYARRLTEEEIKDFRDPMITPFIPGQISKVPDEQGVMRKIVSMGTSSMGYDVTLGRKYKVFTNLFNALIDPLNMPDNAYVDHEGDFVIIPPNSYVLGHTAEEFNIPRDVGTICLGKSTYARVGCSINVTPIEPGFKGNVVIEIANQTPLPMKVYSGMGIAQFIFLKGEPCEVSYADRNGKYQNQTGIQTAIV